MTSPNVTDEIKRASALADLGLVNQTEDPTLTIIVNLLASVMDAPVAYIGLVDESSIRIKSASGVSAKTLPREQSFCGHVVNTGSVLIVEDARAEIGFRDQPLVTGKSQIRAYAGAPLTTSQNLTVGTICVMDREPRLFSREQILQLNMLANLAANHLSGGTKGGLDSTQELVRKFEAGEILKSERLAAIGNIAGAISHDFNNLLGILVGNLSLLKREISSDPKIAARLDASVMATRRAGDLSERLQSFARQSRAPGQVTNINEYISMAENDLTAELGREVSLQLRLGQGTHPVEIDRADFKTSLISIIRNAKDAMSSGGHVAIETVNRSFGDGAQDDLPAGDYVVMSVIDDGMGIDPETARSALEPLYSTKTQGAGTGMGLSEAYAFTRRSGGSLRITAEPDGGTRVQFFLPRSLGQEQPLEPSDNEAMHTVTGTETILVVDDEPELREIAAQLLEGYGYTTVCAGDGPSAIKILESDTHIDLLFTDVIMPGGMNGLELAEKSRRIRPTLPILLTSGFTGRLMQQYQGEPLLESMLQKPYEESEIAERVRQTIDQNETAAPALRTVTPGKQANSA